MVTVAEIQRFIAVKTGAELSEITEDCDIDNDLGCTGDDFDELMLAYSKEFNVKMDTYLWFFHTSEEGQNIGAIFFKPPSDRVTHIPVTPKLLLDFANKGSWDIAYPSYKLPKRRYDIIFTQLLAVVVATILIYKCSH
jgi:hypothetical protein